MAQVFRLTKAITGITFSPEGRGSLSTLPIDAQIRLTSQTSSSGFVEVTYCDKAYCIFRVDLTARSVAVQAIAAAASYGARATFGSLPLGHPATNQA